MSLSRFLRDHTGEIVAEWESFARTQLPAAANLSDLALRDHAAQILEAIALDIDTEQTSAEQYAKSRGLAPVSPAISAASTHGSLRHASGFTLLQLTAEYRALRATVLRLWLPACEGLNSTTNDIIRFNEAIDQALAESVVTYSGRVASTRDLFLAILGHDLRAPLAAMSLSGALLKQPGLPADRTLEIGDKVERCAKMMRGIIGDLLEFARVHLGSHIPVKLESGDLREVCDTALEDAAAVYPDCPFQLSLQGDLAGAFDRVRLHQLLTNLLLNAAQYRSQGSPVVLSAEGDDDTLTVRVHDRGSVIPEDSLEAVFAPLIQLPNGSQGVTRPATSLGLGLFVAREIASAHGGGITVKSNEAEGTEFTVHLPRNGQAAPA